MKHVVKYLSLVLSVLAVMASKQPAFADDATAQKRLVNAGIVSIISGGIRGTYIRIAADLADALDDQYDLRVLPVIGKGSVRNIEDLLYLRGIDVAIVQSDVLDFYRRGKLIPNIEQRIRYITKLYNEEIHILAKSELDSVDQLAGRRVNFGTEGSGTFMTSGIIFDDLGIEVEVTTYPEPAALEQLRAGEIDALVFVGGKPLALLEPVGSDEQLHLLAIPADRIKGAYVPAALTADAYPSLIKPDAAVPTVAVSAVMAAYNWPANHPRGQKVNRFIDHFFANFDRLMQPPFHPKWQEVNLDAEIPGWQRIRTLPELESATAAPAPSSQSPEAESTETESTETEIAKAEIAEAADHDGHGE